MTYQTLTELDPTDYAIIERRANALAEHGVPIVGDWIDFPDGTRRRISHIWRADWMNDPDRGPGYQTSDGGSWYLGDGYTSFSGSLYSTLQDPDLTPADETRHGSCWFFHHDHHRAHNGIETAIPFRVWNTTQEPPR